MKDTIHSLSVAAKNSVIGALILGIAFGGLQLAYERFTPDHWWVEYSAVSSTGRIIEGGLDMTSDSVFPRGGTVIWTDRLFCDVPPGEGFRFFSSFFDTAVLQPDTDFATSPWVYRGALPSEGIDCYMESTIVLKTFFNMPHQEFVTSNTFTIGG